MEQAPRRLGLDITSYHRVKSAYDKAKEAGDFDWRMVAREASVAWEEFTGVEWWILYHTFKAEVLDEEALVQYNKTWEGMSLSVVDKPPSVVGAPIVLSTDEADTNNNDDGMDGVRGYHVTTKETRVLAALGILKYTLHAWEMASEKCWKFIGGKQLVSWEKYLALVYKALMDSTARRFYKIFTEIDETRGLDWLMYLFEGTLQLDCFVGAFEGGSNFPLIRGMGNGPRIRLWKCQVQEQIWADGNEDTMTADEVDKKVMRRISDEADGTIGMWKLAAGSWKLRGPGRCLTDAEWIRILETDTHLDALIVKCGKRWTELLKRLKIETTRSGEDIKKDFFAYVLPNLSEFGATGEKVVRPLNLRDRYTMITICHSMEDSCKEGLAKAVMELLQNEVLSDRKKDRLQSQRFWRRAFTRICTQELSQADTVVDVIEFFHMNFEAYQKIFPMIY